MEKGKAICKVLRAVRQRIAKENGISYKPAECHHEGECSGTCPGCEKELRYLEEQLRNKQRGGLGLKVAGIAAGICATVMPITAAAQVVKSDSTANHPVHTAKQGDVKVVDLSDSCASPVVVRGMVIGSDDKEPVIGASVFIDGTNKGDVTNIDGQFALKVPPDTSLVISYIGYKTKKVHVSYLLHSDNNVIVLEAYDLSGVTGEFVIVSPNYDDVYGHRTYKPKSHKEKNKKKCK